MKSWKRGVALLVATVMLGTSIPMCSYAKTNSNSVKEATFSNIGNDDLDTKSAVPYNPTDWQSYLAKDFRLGSMVIPWSHDSGTYNIKFTRDEALYQNLMKQLEATLIDRMGGKLGKMISLFIEVLMIPIKPVLKKIGQMICDHIQKLSGQCQNLTITGQLEAGVRGLDLRYRYDDGAFHIYHGDAQEGLAGVVQVCYCYDEHNQRLTLEKCFKEVSAFLQKHPSEFVLISVSNEGGNYDQTVENALFELEKKYGISRKMQSMDKKSIGYLEYSQIKSVAYDVTDKIYDETEASWNATVAKKKELLREHLFETEYGNNVLKKCECNIAVKIWKAHDPNNECAFPIEIIWGPCVVPMLPFSEMPIGLNFDLALAVKSPHDQAIKVNQAVFDMLEEYNQKYGNQANSMQNEEKDLWSIHSPGLIGMDFVNEKMCWAVANHNGVRTWRAPKFIYEKDSVEDSAWDCYRETFMFDDAAIKQAIDDEVPERDNPVIYHGDDDDVPEKDNPVIYHGDDTPEKDNPVIYHEDDEDDDEPEEEPIIFFGGDMDSDGEK